MQIPQDVVEPLAVLDGDPEEPPQVPLPHPPPPPPRARDAARVFDGASWRSPAGHLFHFKQKPPGKSSSTGYGSWQCTCHYHPAVRNNSGTLTYCTRTLCITAYRSDDDVIELLKAWACECEAYESKQDHQRMSKPEREKRARVVAPSLGRESEHVEIAEGHDQGLEDIPSSSGSSSSSSSGSVSSSSDDQ